MYSSLSFALPFSLSIVIVFLLERLINSLLCLLYQKERNASVQCISSWVEMVCHLFYASIFSFANLISSLLNIIVWVFTLLLISSVLYITFEESSWLWTDAIRTYNAYLGPVIQVAFVELLHIFNILFKGVIPIWNGSVYFISRILQGYLIPTIIQEAGIFSAMGTDIFNFCKHLSISFYNWLGPAVLNCPESDGDACFAVARHTLDLVTPLKDFRNVVISLNALIEKVCKPSSPVLSIITYPFMDLNFAIGLHYNLNAFLYLFVHLPKVTYTRCKRFGSSQPLLCTPDMQPFYDFLTSSIREMGIMINNWVSATFSIVQGLFGYDVGHCESSTLLQLPESLKTSIFGGNRTALVGLAAWMVAMTDGTVIAYYSGNSVRLTSWHSPINVSLGVAAVSYSLLTGRDASALSASDPTALFGCSCLNQDIQCSIMPFEAASSSQGVRIVSASAFLCSDVDIHVQSVRWPQTRYTSQALPMAAGQVDATLWLVPRSGCGRESTECFCYPFCMGTRLAASQDSPIVLYSADQWRSKVFVVRRDCALQSNTPTMPSDLSVNTQSMSDAGIITASSEQDQTRFVQSSGSDPICTDNPLLSTILNRTLHAAYSPAQYLRDPTAPFVITGDTLLYAVQHGNGEYTVRVERLTGAAASEYTLSVLTENFPSNPPPSTPGALFSQFPRDHLTMPYARQATLAVSSQYYVFYAVNPAMEVYDAYLKYCRHESFPQFGIIMVSSFSPIRIWRVDAYRRCGQQGCGTNLVRQTDIPDAFSGGAFDPTGATLASDCQGSYNEGVEQLEYVNPDNIAVTVKHTNVNGSLVQHRVYWLHPETMLLQTSPWTQQPPISAPLCPAMQSLFPQVGTFAAEAANAPIFLVKMVLDFVVYLPGIVHLWSTGSICPLLTHSHSVLEQCGSKLFLLDDFFSSLQTATNVFWSTLNIISNYVGTSTGVTAAQFVQNALNGMARYGAGSIDIWTAKYQVLTIMKTGPYAMMQSSPASLLQGSVGMPGVAQGAYSVSANALGWARFGYTCIVRVVVTIVQNVLLNHAVDATRAWRIAVNTLEEMREDFDSDIVDNLKQSCAGLALMLGMTNPWAVFVYQQCIAANTVLASGVDLSLSIFSLAPFTRCMCTGSSGKVFAEYAKANCVSQASTRLRPVLLEMIQAASGTAAKSVGDTPATALCNNMITYTKSSMVAAVQPWFDAQFASMNALASSLDYTLSWFDINAGDCLNYDQDPDVVVIMPYPADYFQNCASTSLCRARCASLWDAFDAANSDAVSIVTAQTIQAESLFFPAITADSFNPMSIHALMDYTDASCCQACGGVAVAGISKGSVLVNYYCVPTLMTASVYKARAWKRSVSWGNSVYQMRFIGADSVMALTESGGLYLVTDTTTTTLTTMSLQSADIGSQVMSITQAEAFYLPPLASIHISLIFRDSSGRISGRPLHRKLVLPLPVQEADIVWATKGVEFIFDAGYSATQIVSPAPFNPSSSFLLLPSDSRSTPVMYLATVSWDTEVSNGVVAWSLTQLPQNPLGIETLLQYTLAQNCRMDPEGAYVAYTGAPPYQATSWLSQARISGVYAQLYSSQAVQFEVKKTSKCMLNSCSSCPDGEVQRLCDALQRCTVVNCVGTPVNMRRTMCQIGQTIADQSRQTLAIVHGMWVVFIDMFMTIMELSLTNKNEVTIAWPDDSFYGYICTVKDQQAHFVSIITSALNEVLQFGQASLVYLEGGAHAIDSNFNAMVTMPLTALTSFITQIFLGMLYPLIISQKLIMCQTQGFLAIFDPSGFTVNLGMKTSGNLVGQCLTQRQLINSDDAGSASSIVQQVTQTAALALLPQLTFRGQSLESISHTIDAVLSWLSGVLQGLADVMQSLDMAHCKMPDYYLNETVLCACGDEPYAIPLARRLEGIAELGLWCAGTLSLLDASNTPFVIYNPYTYAQLMAYAYPDSGPSVSDYLTCRASGDQQCSQPQAPVLQAQGVGVLTVITACRTNYMNMQWDKAAYVLFNRSLFSQVVIASYPSLPPTQLVDTFGGCLVDPNRRQSCLQDYITLLKKDPETYWVYQATTDTADACHVFTGPALNPLLTPEQRSTFRACLDQYPDSNCRLSSNLWTPQSDNLVPVASRHGVTFNVSDDNANMIVRLKFDEARALITKALTPLQNYSNDQLQTIFFSPEGDIMHQMMDCVFMGPYTRVPYWAADSQRTLPVPVWHRDANGTSRAVDPTTCVAQSSDRLPPYSCGSDARQAVIKYFFRDYLQKNQHATMSTIIKSMVSDIQAAWANPSLYFCPDCPGFLPKVLDVPYQTVPPETILRSLTVQLQTFYRIALEDPQVWTKYSSSMYDWTSSQSVVTREALYHAHRPVINYDATEARSPMLTTALWQQCHGLLSQVFFTIPMAQGDIPRNVPNKPLHGPDALQAFVTAVVQEAFAHSPLYRHYNVSYVPSQSVMCKQSPKRMAQKVSVTPYNTILDTAGWPTLPAYGPDAFPFSACFCGWDTDGTMCFPPTALCSYLPCPYRIADEKTALLGLANNVSFSCPALQASDQWGVMDSAEADDWLAGVVRDYTISGFDLLKTGRGGLKVGNYKSMATFAVPPTTARVLKPADVVMPLCENDYNSMPSEEQLRSFIHNLFPVAQGVSEASSTAYCLRFAIESALLTAMKMSNVTFAEQQLQVDIWRTR